MGAFFAAVFALGCVLTGLDPDFFFAVADVVALETDPFTAGALVAGFGFTAVLALVVTGFFFDTSLVFFEALPAVGFVVLEPEPAREGALALGFCVTAVLALVAIFFFLDTCLELFEAAVLGLAFEGFEPEDFRDLFAEPTALDFAMQGFL